LELGFKTHPIVGDVKTVIGAIETKDFSIPTPYPPCPELKHCSNHETLQAGQQRTKAGTNHCWGRRCTNWWQWSSGYGRPLCNWKRRIYVETAKKVKEAGAKILRGGAFKPRTSPYSFQGLEEEGLKIMAIAREVTGLKLVTEVVDTRDVELVASYTDIIQIGARTCKTSGCLKRSECPISPYS